MEVVREARRLELFKLQSVFCGTTRREREREKKRKRETERMVHCHT